MLHNLIDWVRTQLALWQYRRQRSHRIYNFEGQDD